MEAVILCGVQGSGKSTFCRERLFHTHVRINLDMLQSRHRETLLLAACLNGKQSFVIDNTNPTTEERARYVAPSRSAGFRVVCYFFHADIRDALVRNELRQGTHRVPERGVLGTHSRLQPPSLKEGFDAMFRVQIGPQPNEFLVETWRGGH